MEFGVQVQTFCDVRVFWCEPNQGGVVWPISSEEVVAAIHGYYSLRHTGNSRSQGTFQYQGENTYPFKWTSYKPFPYMYDGDQERQESYSRNHSDILSKMGKFMLDQKSYCFFRNVRCKVNYSLKPEINVPYPEMIVDCNKVCLFNNSLNVSLPHTLLWRYLLIKCLRILIIALKKCDFHGYLPNNLPVKEKGALTF